MDKDQHFYKIVEESKEDPLLTVIEKSGIKVRFTLLDIRNNLINATKKITEFQSMWKVAEATKQNIKRTHPHIAEMSDEDLTAAYLYRQAIGTATTAQEKLQEWTEAKDMDEKSLEEAMQQTGIKIPEPKVKVEVKGEEPQKEQNDV